jgi:hypothetical protein
VHLPERNGSVPDAPMTTVPRHSLFHTEEATAWAVRGSNCGKGKRFCNFSKIPGTALGFIQPPSQQAPGTPPRLGGGGGLKQWGVKLTTHLDLMLRLRLSGVLPLLLPCVCMKWIRTLPFYIYCTWRHKCTPMSRDIVCYCRTAQIWCATVIN